MEMDSLKWIIGFFIIWSTLSCGKTSTEQARSNDPARCTTVDLGEAANLVDKDQIADDRMVILQGIADPRALVWRDSKTGEVFYITKVMGTEQRFFFLKKIADEDKPGIASQFQGYLTRWDRIPIQRSAPIANALSEQYNIKVKPEWTYVIDANGKPEGCP